MFRTFLSLRYLRARKTSWIGMAGIFVAVAALVLILSIMAGFLAESRRTLRGNLADLQVMPAFQSSVLQDNGNWVPMADDIERMLEIIEAHPKVVAATPQLQWVGILAPDGGEQALEKPMQDAIQLIDIVGIDVEREADATDFAASLEALPSKKKGLGEICLVGRPESHEDPFQNVPTPFQDGPRARPRTPILVGEQLAYLWGLRRGQEIAIVTATYDESTSKLNETPANARFQVVGSFRSMDNETDSRRIYMDRRDLADFLQRERMWSSVLIKLEDYERDKDDVRLELWEQLHAENFVSAPGIRPSELRTWEDFRATLLAAIENEKSLMGIMLSLVLVVAGFTVFALLSMMVTEKRRDIGILCALGATSRGVLALFLMIGLWEAVIGAFFGALAGVWGAINIDAIERNLSKTFGFEIFNRDIYLFDHIPAEVTPSGVAWIVGGAVVCTLLFAAIPAWRASRLDPVEALRHE
ncbi:MAG: FtsX-like permease family protein [Planctomycetota bacterium]